MRVLILYANPVETSYGAALHREAIAALSSRGHAIDDCDLYAESFDPSLSKEERIGYHETATNRIGVSPYADRLLAADALILIYPVWNEGFPAILKGFLDRVFLPGVSFKIVNGASQPNLQNLKKISAVCTYGADRLSTFLLGDPPRRVVKRLLRAMSGRDVTCDYLALYDMNRTTLERRAAFISKVKTVLEQW
jgi:NAD(P)H dehydrogenase (quinone)